MSFQTNKAEHLLCAKLYFVLFPILALVITTLKPSVLPLCLLVTSLKTKLEFNVPIKMLGLIPGAYLLMTGGGVFPDLDLKDFFTTFKHYAMWAPTLGFGISLALFPLESFYYYLCLLPGVIYLVQRILESATVVGGHRNSLLHNRYFWTFLWAVISYINEPLVLFTVGNFILGCYSHLWLDYAGSNYKPLFKFAFKQFVNYVFVLLIGLGVSALLWVHTLHAINLIF